MHEAHGSRVWALGPLRSLTLPVINPFALPALQEVHAEMARGHGHAETAARVRAREGEGEARPASPLALGRVLVCKRALS